MKRIYYNKWVTHFIELWVNIYVYGQIERAANNIYTINTIPVSTAKKLIDGETEPETYVIETETTAYGGKCSISHHENFQSNTRKVSTAINSRSNF